MKKFFAFLPDHILKCFFSIRISNGIITSIGTFVSIAFGEYISSFLSLEIANTIGSLIIVAAGLWVIWVGKQDTDREEFAVRKESSQIQTSYDHSLVTQANLLTGIIKDLSRADIDKSGNISNYEAMTLGVALTMNNLSAGIGGGMYYLLLPLYMHSNLVLSLMA